jgi:hypothetical protein
MFKKECIISQVPVAPESNPSYLGSWDWEDCSSGPAQAYNLSDLIFKIPISWMSPVKWCTSVTPAIQEAEVGPGLAWVKAQNPICKTDFKKSKRLGRGGMAQVAGCEAWL